MLESMLFVGGIFVATVNRPVVLIRSSIQIAELLLMLLT